ncbi:MAG: helix-turn-helix domain-containing protein [Nitrospirales bacterium]
MRVEKGDRMPSIDTLLRIATALEIDLGALIQRASNVGKSGGES